MNSLCSAHRVKSLLIVLILLVSNALPAQTIKAEFSAEEKKALRQSNGTPLAFFHKKQMKEFVRLMNLARTNPPLLKKYIDLIYGPDYTTEMPWALIEKAYARNRKNISLLRPSVGLHLGAFYHAVDSGIKGSTGHQNFNDRLLLSLNFNTLRPLITSGENCEYGSRSAINIFEGLINSAPHRANILHPDYMRVGVSRKHHKKYGYNTVTMFSGPKLQDWVLYAKQSHLTVNK